MMRTRDQAAKASKIVHLGSRHSDRTEAEDEEQEDRRAAGERREREDVPAAREQLDRLGAESREARAPPSTGPRLIRPRIQETNRATASPTSWASPSE